MTRRTNSVAADVPSGAVVVGLDGGPLDETILRVADRLADDTGRSLHIVHTIVPTMPARFAADNASAVGAIRAAADRRHMIDLVCAGVAGLVARVGLDPITATIAVDYGDPATTLLGIAEPQDVIVIGARGAERPEASLLLGTVSQDVAVHACCPVMLVPPVQARGPSPETTTRGPREA